MLRFRRFLMIKTYSKSTYYDKIEYIFVMYLKYHHNIAILLSQNDLLKMQSALWGGVEVALTTSIRSRETMENSVARGTCFHAISHIMKCCSNIVWKNASISRLER